MPKIEIALAANAPYFCGMLVTVCSIAKSARTACRLSFNILDGGLEEIQKAFMERCVKDFHPDSTFRYLLVNDELFENYPAWHGNKMAYARLMLPTALPDVKWIVYCDVDFLWLRDIAELWAERDDSLAFVGVQDLCEVTRRSEKAWFEARGYPFDMDNYFCSGLCFMNLKAFREEGLVGKIKDVLDKHKDIQFPDQAALNIVTWGRRKLVDGRWQRFARNLTADDLSRGVVIHHAGAIPWKRTSWVLNPLTDATMMWHRANAKFRGISVWRSLRTWFPIWYILWHRGIYWLAQVPGVKWGVKTLCAMSGHQGAWRLFEANARRLG